MTGLIRLSARAVHAPIDVVEIPACRICGCTDADCSGCVARTGAPCRWVEPDLCSACEVELRWSGEYRIKPAPFVEPVMPEWMQRLSDELFYGPKFDSARYGR